MGFIGLEIFVSFYNCRPCVCVACRSAQASGSRPLTDKQLAKKAEREQKKAETLHLKEVTSCVNLCAKAMPVLTAQVNSIALALKQIDKEGVAEFGGELEADLKQAKGQFQDWKVQATDLLHAAETNKAKTDPSKVHFSKELLEGAVKAAVSTMTVYKEKMRSIREKKAAAKAAAPPKATRAKAKAKQ